MNLMDNQMVGMDLSQVNLPEPQVPTDEGQPST
jgi:hypothetical protein